MNTGRRFCRGVLLLALACVWSAQADDRFEYHAYIRSGVLEGSTGGKGVPFQAPGAPAKYRLGNEAETYGEAILVKNFNMDEPKGPSAKVETLLAYKTLNDNQWSSQTDEFTVREAYAEFGNFDFSKNVTFWAGSRFYRRQDIHINDFYWLDTSGYGGGMQNLPLGSDKLKLHLAYLRGSPDNAVDLDNVGLITKQMIDARLEGDMGKAGTLEFVALPSYVRGGDYETTLKNGDEEQTTTTKVDSETGIGLCLIHTKNHSIGFNKAGVQWGNSVAKDFGSSLWATPDPVVGSSSRLRLLDYGVIQPNDSWSMMYVGIWDRYDNGQHTDAITDWYSAGLRPLYSFTKNFALAVEAGVDYTCQEGAATDGGDLKGAVGKLTICPEIRLSNDFWARPVLRAFVTVAKWSSDFEGSVGGTPYADDTRGLNYGVQMEAWF
ncbi:MAG: carbohydrate porin [Kiritimatiellae bacterium]|nr:carbohydrate porin [Kiritimatiellia bacterium]